MKSAVWIVDFGSQYTQLITRRARELGLTSEIMTVEKALEKIKSEPPKALVLSGGPQSVFEDKTDYSPFFANPKLPVLGVCYGMQLMAQYFGGKVERGVQGEYGISRVKTSALFNGIPGGDFKNSSFMAWMSHSDHVVQVPKDFEVILESENGLCAGFASKSRPLLSYQFHPEVQHTEFGTEWLKYFLFTIAELKQDWSTDDMLSQLQETIRQSDAKHILCAFSGGVDSLVAATLVQKIYPEKLHCFFVDHGLLRPQDEAHIHTLQKATGLNVHIVQAEEIFLDKLKGVSDPEEKRKIIGRTFIEVFENEVHRLEQKLGEKVDTLLQGTIYPDVIESKSPHEKGGKSVTIKSHHNVGGLPERMKLKLLEPLRYLFKDEVRKLGAAMGLAAENLNRHPFPGPGLGVRIMGEVTSSRLKRLKKSDQILVEELKSQGLYGSTWQAFTVYLPVKTVGVKGDGRVVEEVIAVRAVNSTDGMTASVTEFPWSFLTKVSSRIVNEVEGITRVVYDITQKPPGTIEWE